MRTQVGIIGAGPAGLMLAHLLAREKIESVVLEVRSREYVQERVRAGVLEQGTVDLMRAAGVGARLAREGLLHRGIELRFARGRHRIDLSELTDGAAITIYGQNEVIKDLTDARVATGQPIFFECATVSVHGFDAEQPTIRFAHGGTRVIFRGDQFEVAALAAFLGRNRGEEFGILCGERAVLKRLHDGLSVRYGCAVRASSTAPRSSARSVRVR